MSSVCERVCVYYQPGHYLIHINIVLSSWHASSTVKSVCSEYVVMAVVLLSLVSLINFALSVLLYLYILLPVCRFGEDSMEVMESLNFLFRKFHQLNISNEEYCCLKTIMFLNRGNTYMNLHTDCFATVMQFSISVYCKCM